MAECVFLDSNVVLDHLADRQPFAEYAHRLFSLGETGKLSLAASALTFCNLYYLLRKQIGNDETVALLTKLSQLVKITPVGSAEIRAALSAGYRDFEDAVQVQSALAASGVIVTRNKVDFPEDTCRVQSPEEFLSWYEENEAAT
jgi:predicted nucleic acid-binding protein